MDSAVDAASRAAFVVWLMGVGSAALTAVFALSCWRIGERVIANVKLQSFADVVREWEQGESGE